MKKLITKLVVGLGNHSMITTRHSIGMAVLNSLADDFDVPWQYESRCAGFIAHLSINSYNIILLKPSVPMNINGKSILKTVNRYDVSHSDVLLVHDHLDKPLGKIQIKLDGSAGGHNGVKSAIASLRTDKIKRLRIGIDRPTSKNNIVKYVLQGFKSKELLLVETTIEQCMDLIKEEVGMSMNINSIESFEKLDNTILDQESRTLNSIPVNPEN